MKKPVLFYLAMLLLATPWAGAEFWGFEASRNAHHGKVWEASLPDFSGVSYHQAVQALLAAFEESTGKRLEPGIWNRAAIKVDTNAGAGLGTPPGLTEAVIEALVERGFERGRLLVLDARESMLRACGYLPPLSAQETDPRFAGAVVAALDSDRFYSDRWFYESPVPPEFATALGRELLRIDTDPDDPAARRSMLPAVLLSEVDFWINLPMVTDHPALGLNGALVNATLWNISNRQRFFLSPANAPVAVAEIAAIPEFKDTLALTIMTLERYQFIGGPGFNSFYTVSEPTLWLSPDPVIVDALVLQRINRVRQRHGFPSLGSWLPLLEFAMDLNVGEAFTARARVQEVELPPASPDEERPRPARGPRRN